MEVECCLQCPIQLITNKSDESFSFEKIKYNIKVITYFCPLVYFLTMNGDETCFEADKKIEMRHSLLKKLTFVDLFCKNKKKSGLNLQVSVIQHKSTILFISYLLSCFTISAKFELDCMTMF